MTRTLSFAAIGVLLTGLLGAAAAQAQAVYATNYDLLLTVGGETHQVRSQARVRSGHSVPATFRNHRVEFTVSQQSTSRVRIDIRIFEKARDGWQPVTAQLLTIAGGLGMPLEYTWNNGELELDIAIVVSAVPR